MQEYKVIEILDEYNIMINYGFYKGAREGKKLRIVSRGEKIINEDTSELLGTLDAIKAVVSVKTAYENFSICHQLRTTEVPILSPLANMMQQLRTEERLPVDPDMISHRVIPKGGLITVGDIAVPLPD